jgi:hypothetical protein
VLIGNSLGGNDPNPISPRHPLATNRLLNPYVPARQAWICPSDRGFGKALTPTTAGVLGNSYRFSWSLSGDYYLTSGVAEDPRYNLGLKKEFWVPEPARFILFHDMAFYPWTEGIAQWHNTPSPGKVWDSRTIRSAPESMVGTVGFVDGHAQMCDFSRTFKKGLDRGLEPGRDFMWYKPLR